MKVQLDRDRLNTALAGIPPFDDAIRIGATKTDSRLALTMAGVDMTYRVETEAQVRKPGQATLPAEPFTAVVGRMPPGTVTLENVGDFTRLVGEGPHPIIELERVSMLFPEKLSVPDDTVRVDGARLATAIDQVGFCVSAFGPDTGRWQTGGVLFDSDPTRLRLVGTDGYRLAWSDLPPVGISYQRVLPLAPLKSLCRFTNDGLRMGVTGDSPDSERTGVTGDSLVFKSDDTTVTVRPLTGRFPDHLETLLNCDYPTGFVCDRAHLTEALDRVRVMCEDLMCLLQAGKDEVTFHAAGNPGRVTDRVEVTRSGTADDVSLHVNVRRLAETVEKLTGSTVRMLLPVDGDRSPMWVDDPTDDRAGFLVMPAINA